MKTKQIIPQKSRPPSEAASILLIRGSEASSQTTEVIETQRDGSPAWNYKKDHHENP